MVDGRITSSEGYQNFSSLIGSDGTQFGDAFFSCDAGFLYFALRFNSVDTGGAVANENVYGPREDKKTGELDYNDIYQTGWNKHDFKALIKSDRARFQTSCGGTVFHDFVQDYLRATGSSFASDPSGDGEVIVAGPADSASSLKWNLENPAQTGWGDDPGEILIDPAKKSKAQSPPFNPLYPDYDAEYDGWVWEMIYEFRIPISDYQCGGEVLFGLPDFTGSTAPSAACTARHLRSQVVNSWASAAAAHALSCSLSNLVGVDLQTGAYLNLHRRLMESQRWPSA